MRNKDKAGEGAQDFTGMPASSTVTAAEIQQKEFRVSRFGGYRMRDVDEFLDQITETMTKLTEDNVRLRSASGLPISPSPLPIGAPDLADTSRQADEIIQRARAEAADIVQNAREQAAATAGDSSTDAGRAAVAAFLSQEKNFLQELASLVQGHAESVKGMAKASRSAAKRTPVAAPSDGATPAAASPEPPTPTPSPPPATPVIVDATRSEPAKPVEAPKGPQAQANDAAPMATEPIRVQEPATASVAASESDDEGSSGEGDRTLRELFWGEE